MKVNTLSIPQGLTSYEHNSLYNGILPNYIVIGLVTNSSYSGNVTKNPFNFVNADLRHIQLKVNERLLPTVAITPNYPENQFIDAYESIYSVVGRLHQDWSNGLQFNDYLDGTTLYGF